MISKYKSNNLKGEYLNHKSGVGCNKYNTFINDFVYYLGEGSHEAGIVKKTHKSMLTIDFAGGFIRRVSMDNCIFQ